MARKLAPMHPGEVLREEFLVPLGLSAGALAKACGVPRTRIERIANEETAVTADTRYGLARRSGRRPSFG
jgi:addiction module HigA family antidote